MPGCVHLLPLIYIDALIRHKALVLPPAIALPDGEPMIHFVRSEHLDFLASADVSSKSKDRIEYGLLQASGVDIRFVFLTLHFGVGSEYFARNMA